MNAYFICVIVPVQMWYVYTQLLDDQTQKDFWVFYMFLKVFLCILCVQSFFQIVHFIFCWKKNYFKGIFVIKSQVSHE